MISSTRLWPLVGFCCGLLVVVVCVANFCDSSSGSDAVAITGATTNRNHKSSRTNDHSNGASDIPLPRSVSKPLDTQTAHYGGEPRVSRVVLQRTRRALKEKSGLVRLAQRPKPKTSTTTTSSTTTTAASSASKSESAANAEDESETTGGSPQGSGGDDDYSSDDYEPIAKSDRKSNGKLDSPKTSTSSARSKSKSKSKTESKSVKVQAKEELEEESAQEDGNLEAEEEEELVESTTTSKPTSTSTKSSARKSSSSNSSSSSSGRQAKNRKGRPKNSGDSQANEDEESNDKVKSETKGSGSNTRATTASAIATMANKEAESKPAKAMKKKPLVALPFIKPKNDSSCTPEAYLEFPRDLIGNKWRSRGLVVIHIAVVCYMFYSLALVCERYFMPSLEEFSQRLGLSEDVAGATLMSAGSSAPELFTAILGVFVAKGDVGTGAIVGSAVFNILFVIGLCAFVSTTTAQLQWWPVLRDSVFYTFTVLVLILFIYDERITAMESFMMLALYGVYICIMIHNEPIKQQVTRTLQSYPVTAKLLKSAVSLEGPDDVFGGGAGGSTSSQANYQSVALTNSKKQSDVEDDAMYLAAQLVIVRHKRLFRSQLRFQSAARYIIVKRQHRMRQKSLKRSDEVNYVGPESEPLRPGKAVVSISGSASATNVNNQRERMEAYARTATASKSKFSIVSKDDYELWNRPPEEGENYYLWLAKIPASYVLHYTIPDCLLYPDKYLFTFFISILWTAFFSYVMVWMVTLIGFTLGIPDSVMGVTFLAAGTSVPDCYSSIHAARNGMADMAVSNSIGSNVFDILIGLSLPWFIQTAIYPGVVATINSRGVIYSVILLFLSLVVTIYLLNKYDWTLKPRLGLALLIAYGLFIVLTCMLEFNLFGHVNPPPCKVP